MSRTTVKFKLIFFLAPLLFGIFSLEFVVLPIRAGLPRATLLGGFGTPEAMLDGTRISSLGFAGDSISPSKSPEVKRILILGSSNVFIRGFADRLRIRLEQKFLRPFEIVGAAGGGHFSHSQIIKFHQLSRYGFDIVLIALGFNDLRANHVAPDLFRDDFSHRNPYYHRNFALDHSLIARLIYNKLIYRKPPKTYEGSHFRSLEITKKNLRKLIRLVKKDHAAPIILQSPWHIPENYSLQKFQANQLGFMNPENLVNCSAEVWGTKDFLKKGIVATRAIEEKTALAEHVGKIDLAPTLNKDPTNFGDVFHLSDPGTDKAISLIVTELEKKHLISAPGNRWRTYPPNAAVSVKGGEN